MHLLLNLGHNSAAIGLRANGTIIAGYEEERLSRVKSSSAFPTRAIQKILDSSDEHLKKQDNVIFISHWFDDFDFMDRPSTNVDIGRYYDPDIIQYLKDSFAFRIETLSKDFTHHDAHAMSAVSFFENHAAIRPESFHVAVADGFGNQQEVFTLYTGSYTGSGQVKLNRIMRLHGYDHSLGLIYQYATAYCGMQMHQDEYKFLGYESKILSVLNNVQIMACNEVAATFAAHLLTEADSTEPKSDKYYVDTTSLKRCRQKVDRLFDTTLAAIGSQSMNSNVQNNKTSRRVVVGYLVQQIVEAFYTQLIRRYDIKNMLVAGGVHYNVKVNNTIAKHVPGFFCAAPLAGDQGACIGLYTSLGHNFPFHGLLWGHRNLAKPQSLPDGLAFGKNVFYFNNREAFVDFVSQQVADNELVNIITGSMEFGPRALCNTSTLALANSQNVKAINDINGRDTVMPFAGVMLAENVMRFHNTSEANRVIGSLQYMITTLDYRKDSTYEDYGGIMHRHPTKAEHTGRPQVVVHKERPVFDILTQLNQVGIKAIINTSLNVHGVPIVYSVRDAIGDLDVNLMIAKQHGFKAPVLAIGDF